MNAATYVEAAGLIKALYDNVKLPETPLIVLGDIDKARLATALESSPYSSELFAEGVLIVPQVLKKNDAIGYVHRLVIEGVGHSPEVAMMNALSGGIREEVHDLNEHMDQFFADEYPDETTGLVRAKNKEKGFFLRLSGDKWEFPDGNPSEYIEIPMQQLRQAAAVKFASLAYLSNSVYRDSVTKAVESQRRYYALYDEFRDVFRMREREMAMDEILALRKSAIEDLERAQRKSEEAGKWAKLSQGLSVISNILAIGSAVANASHSAAMERAQVQAAEAQSKASAALEAVRVQGTRVNNTTVIIQNHFHEIVPHAPLPDGTIELRMP